MFLTAVDERVTRVCASGALASYHRRIEDGTGIEMAQVIPGFASRFDTDDVLAAAAPRPFLIVSATNDKYSADAAAIVDTVGATAYNGYEDALTHLRYPGGHPLDEERFGAIINWVVQP